MALDLSESSEACLRRLDSFVFKGLKSGSLDPEIADGKGVLPSLRSRATSGDNSPPISAKPPLQVLEGPFLDGPEIWMDLD